VRVARRDLVANHGLQEVRFDVLCVACSNTTKWSPTIKNRLIHKFG